MYGFYGHYRNYFTVYGKSNLSNPNDDFPLSGQKSNVPVDGGVCLCSVYICNSLLELTLPFFL